MPKTYRNAPTFNGVGAGQTATLNMPIGLTYHSLLLTLGGTTFLPSNISEIRMKANGRTIYTVAGQDLNVINQFDGRAEGVTQLVLDFERYGLKTRAALEASSIGTGAQRVVDAGSAAYNPTPLSTLQLEVDIDSSASAPTLSASMMQSAPRPLGIIRHRRKFTYSPSAAGDFEIADLPKGLLIDKLLIKSASDTITAVKIDRDNFRIFDRSAAQNKAVQIDGVRVPQDSWFVYDPTEEGHGAESLATKNVADLRIIITTNASDTLTVYVDYLGPFSG